MKFSEQGDRRRRQKFNDPLFACLPSGFLKNPIVAGSQKRSCRGFTESGQGIRSFVGDVATPILDDIAILLVWMGIMSPVILIKTEIWVNE